MPERAGERPDWEGIRRRFIGLDESLSPKSYYPLLKERLGELEEIRTYQEQRSAALVNLLEDLEDERRKAEESEARLKAAFGNLPFAFWSVDREGRVQLANEIARKRYGLRIGGSLDEAVSSRPAAAALLEDFRGALSGEVERVERPMAEGPAVRWLQSIAAPITVDGEVAGVLGVDIDVSRLKRAEASLERLNEELESKVAERTERLERSIEELKDAHARLVMSEKLAAFGRLTAGVAHELNSPLGALKSSSEVLESAVRSALSSVPALIEDLGEVPWPLMRDFFGRAFEEAAKLDRVADRKARSRIRARLADLGVDQPDAVAEIVEEGGTAELFEVVAERFGVAAAVRMVRAAEVGATIVRSARIILHATERAAAVVRTLKNFEMVERNRGEESIELLDVDEEIRATVDLFRARMREDVEVSCSFNAGALVAASRSSLSQVWANLITNALQAMEYAGALEIRTGNDGTSVWAEIADSGPGIPEDIQDRIFDPFFTTKPLGEGTGFGLFTAKHVVERLGGRITFRSQSGRTVFRVSLPLAEAEGRP